VSGSILFRTKTTRYLLIGGRLTCGQAAKQIRGQDADGAITLVGEERYVPYDRPPLSKEFLRGEKPREALAFDPETYFLEQRIELVLGIGVKQIDPGRNTAILSNGESLTFEKALIKGLL
jgi:NADPH-dependent 2,4-dienoyl-CoA reductase/sulfur reductase-like enzyme